MSSVATHHSKHVIDSIRRIYKPEVWLQIYYPLYYMAKAIRKHNDGRQCSVVEADNLLISLDIALLFIWTLWLHALWLIEILFIRRSARAMPKWLSAASKFSNDQISVPLELSGVLALVLRNWLDGAILIALLIWHDRVTAEARNVQKNTQINERTSNVLESEPCLKTNPTVVPHLDTDHRPVLRPLGAITITSMLLAFFISVSNPTHGKYRHSPASLEMVLAVAIINLPTARDTVLDVLIVTGSTTFRQRQTYLIYRSVIDIHLTFLVAWSYAVHYTSSADLRWLMVNLHISDIIGLQLSYNNEHRPDTSNVVTTWPRVRMLGMVLALGLIQILGTILTIQATPAAVDKNGITLSQQTAFLGAILSNHWLCLLILTNGRFWRQIPSWESTKLLLSAEVPTRLSYFGWAGAGGVMDVATTARLWFIGLATLGACGALCWFTDV